MPMRDLLSILSHLPFLIPLGGALLLLALPQDSGDNPDGPRAWMRRALYLFTLLLTLGMLLVNRSSSGIIYQLPFVRGLLPYGESLAWSRDSLGQAYALLMCTTLLLTALGNLAGHQSRAASVLQLVMLAAVLGLASAWNLLTLVLFAILLDIGVMTRSVIRVPEENLQHARRQTLINLASVVLMVLAIVVQMAEQHGSQPVWHGSDGMARELLVLAIILRLGIYPLPGSTKRRWEVYLLSGSAGAFLWLRLALGSATVLPFAHWLAPLSWAAIGISALLAALAPQFSQAVPWLMVNQIAVMLLVPCIAPAAGARVLALALLQWVLNLALLRMDADLLVAGIRNDMRLQRWAPWPFAVALSSLAGVPFSLGGSLRWALIQLCWQHGWNNLIPLLAIAFALLSVPALRRLRRVWTPVSDEPNARPWQLMTALVAACVAAGTLVLAGLLGNWLAGLLVTPYALPVTQPTTGFLHNVVFTLTAYIVPLLGAMALVRIRPPIARRMVMRYEWLNSLLELDWLYGMVEHLGQRLQIWAKAAFSTIEGSFYLLWTLLCNLALALLLLGR